MADDTDDGRDDDYDVGRGKPPRSTRFKKGQSGNPSGRPKAVTDPFSAFERAAGEKVLVTDNGQRTTKAKIEIAFVQLLNAAAKGDKAATAQLLGWVRLGAQRKAPEAADTPLDEDDKRVIASVIERILEANAAGAAADVQTAPKPKSDPNPEST